MATFNETTLGGVALGSLCGSNNPTIAKGNSGSDYDSVATYANVTGIGSVNWGYVGDPVYGCTAPVSGASTTRYLHCTGLGLSIPSGATIEGIQVTINSYSWAFPGYVPASSFIPTEDTIQIIKGGSRVGDNKATYSYSGPSGLASKTHGGSSDLWGTTWSASDFDSDFGVAIVLDLPTPTSSINGCTISGVGITVYYSQVYDIYDETPCLGALVSGSVTTSLGYLTSGGVVAAGLALLSGIGNESGSGGASCSGLSSASLAAAGIEALGGAELGGSSTISTTIVAAGGASLGGGAVTRNNYYRYRNLVSIPAGYSAEKFWAVLALPIPSVEVYYGDDFKVTNSSGDELPFTLRSYEDETLHILVKVGLSALSDTQLYVLHGEY